jgi:tricorn protease
MQGYYRFPSIHKDTVVFVSEDDLWKVSVHGGNAERLTSNLSQITNPIISFDGNYIAFTGSDEGHPEVYVMPLKGGTPKRLTYFGATSQVRGWTKDSKRILFSSNVRQWYARTFFIYSVNRDKDRPQRLQVGPANTIAYGPGKKCVIGRHTYDPATWKRYRGGRVGVLWIDTQGNGRFVQLPKLNGNCTSPMWIKDRIFFISDHEGVGNIYSCSMSGRNLKRHTDHTSYYTRNATTDGEHIVYHAGGDLYAYNIDKDKTTKIEVLYHSPRVQMNRKFIEASKHLEDYAIHPSGTRIAVTSRGRVFSMKNWEGSVLQHGMKSNARYRLGRWLHDGERLIIVTDEPGEDTLQVHFPGTTRPPQTLNCKGIGRVIELEPSPKQPVVAISNHRHELLLVSLAAKKHTILDKSAHHRIEGITWSFDGAWIAYSYADTAHTSCIKLCNTRTRKTFRATKTVMLDFCPRFDPDGQFLYFLSNRHFDPVYDTLQFELSFPANTRAFLIPLRKNIKSPFTYTQAGPSGLDIPSLDQISTARTKKGTRSSIDMDGITERLIALPSPPGKYAQIWALKDKVLFSLFPIEGGIKSWLSDDESSSNGILKLYDLKEQKTIDVVNGIQDFEVSRDNEILVYRAKNQIRVIKPMEKVDEKLPKEPVGPKSGWIDLSRIQVPVEPISEWQQMYRDVWRLQRDHFWTPNMSGIDWHKIYERYAPLLERIGTRSEFSDLIWEMQVELGTSHAYEWGGDYRLEPQYTLGFLGADFVYDKKHDAYRIIDITIGDPWDMNASSPLRTAGCNVSEGDLLIAVNGVVVNRYIPPEELLVNRARTDLSLTIADRNGKNMRTIVVKTLNDEGPARYRDWVEMNRDKVHRLSKGKLGYVHIPDMGPSGFAEFHRYFLAEIARIGLIVDVRYNRGGHVSELLLEKVARKRIAYDVTRWGPPHPYPDASVLGPIVCLTNEMAGSDGDIFSHAFKLYKIGPLIGKRTWGGVIGISPYYTLSDGGITTQPEYSFWFKDVGWGVENYGTDPDIEVDIAPQDFEKGKDPQLECGVRECLALLKRKPPKLPKFNKRPTLKLPERL